MTSAEGPLARIAELARARTESRPPSYSAPKSQQWERTQSPPPRSQPTHNIPDHTADAVGDIDSVTERIALEQELDTIRRTLREKERLVDATADQCRRLEDELEDQHLAYDGLKQDLERKKQSLTTTHEEMARVSRERREIEARYQALLSSGHHGDPTHVSMRRRKSASATLFLGGVLLGILLAAAALGLWLRANSLAVEDIVALGTQAVERPAAAVSKTRATEGSPATAKETNQAVAPAGSATRDEQTKATAAQLSGPVVLRTLRDRLRDGSTGPLMLLVQGGDFTMGRQGTLANDEGPAHGVRLGNFLISASEVTFEAYDRFVRATGRRFPSDYGWGRGRRPVVDVSWNDARAYAKWLSSRTDRHYRLPSEAEWEYAADAGQGSSFWWGFKPETERAACFDCGTQWDNRSTAPVQSFDPNPLGLYDTAGNVMEWTQDCYHPNYKGAPANGQPWGEAGCSYRVARGGAFNKPAHSMRSTARHRFAADTRINALGFRLARDV